MRVLIAFIILTLLLTAAVFYTYDTRRNMLISEGFSEENVSSVEKAISAAVPQLDQATIARVLTVVQRMAKTVLQPEFFTDAIRRSGMSPVELARDYINSQKAKS